VGYPHGLLSREGDTIHWVVYTDGEIGLWIETIVGGKLIMNLIIGLCEENYNYGRYEKIALVDS